MLKGRRSSYSELPKASWDPLWPASDLETPFQKQSQRPAAGHGHAKVAHIIDGTTDEGDASSISVAERLRAHILMRTHVQFRLSR